MPPAFAADSQKTRTPEFPPSLDQEQTPFFKHKPSTPDALFSSKDSIPSLMHGGITDHLIVLRSAMQREIKDIVTDFLATIQVTVGDNDFVIQRGALFDDLTGRGDDAALSDQVAAFFSPCLCDTDYPGAVLVGACLHHQVIVEVLKMVVLRGRGIVKWRVIAKDDHLGSLK